MEIALLQAGNELAAIIHNGDVKDDKVDVLLDGVVGALQRSLGGGGLRGTLRTKRRRRGDR